MNNYYRIKGYDPKHDFTFILDSYGMFEKKWQFSSFLIQRGLKVLDIFDINNPNLPVDKEYLFLLRTLKGSITQ